MKLLLDEPADEQADDEPMASPPEHRPKWGRILLLGFGAVGLTVLVAAAAIAVPRMGDGTGDRSYHPTAFAEVEHHYKFGIGTLDVDLRDVDFPPGTHVIEVDHGIGSARVWLPADVDYDVAANIDAGEIIALDESENGFGSEVDARSTRGGTATVIVDLEVDIGYGRVSQG